MSVKSLSKSLVIVCCFLVLIKVQVQSQNVNTRNDGFQDNCLTEHNAYRAKHGVPALKYDQEMINHAAKRASKLAQTGEMKHDKEYLDKNGLGENLFWFSRKGGVDCKKIVKNWYDERKNYDFNAHKSKGGVTGHFTQVVWKSTTRVGCAQVDADKGEKGTHTVCVYAAPGNVIGQDAQNVPPPRK